MKAEKRKQGRTKKKKTSKMTLKFRHTKLHYIQMSKHTSAVRGLGEKKRLNSVIYKELFKYPTCKITLLRERRKWGWGVV